MDEPITIGDWYDYLETKMNLTSDGKPLTGDFSEFMFYLYKKRTNEQ